MSAEENKAMVRRLMEVWNTGDVAVLDEVIAADAVSHDPSTPDMGAGPEGVKRLMTMYRAAFPDITFTVEDQVADGDMVATRWTSYGTHRAALMGIPPTGKSATVTGMQIDRFAGGKIAETWVNWDTMGLMRQLGVIPQMASAGA